jgi:hypothetical protein
MFKLSGRVSKSFHSQVVVADLIALTSSAFLQPASGFRAFIRLKLLISNVIATLQKGVPESNVCAHEMAREVVFTTILILHSSPRDYFRCVCGVLGS